MKIAFSPYNSQDNKYIELIQKSIKQSGVEIKDFDKIFKDKTLFKDIDFVILNWFENLPESLIKQSASYMKRIIKLLIIKYSRKKIIWVMHNKIPHNLKYIFFSKQIMRFLIKNSYKIIVHSRESFNVLQELTSEYKKIENKIVYIPHPNYIGAYKEFDGIEADDKKLNLLFLGMIKPYKNVDLLIEAFNELNLPDTTLTLAGKPINDNYKNYIIDLIKNNKNIKTEFSFISDDIIQKYIKKSDLLVLPYDIKSSLNSGTIILAFSNKRTVLSPLIGTLKDIQDDEAFFSYEYTDESSHKKALKNGLLRVYNKNKTDIRKMGEKCFSIIEKNNNIDVISECYKKIFFSNIKGV